MSPFSNKLKRYKISVSDTQQLFIGDVLLFLSVSRLFKQNFHAKRVSQRSEYSTVNSTEYNSSDLVELLQQSAVEHMTTYRQLKARLYGSVVTIVTTDFEAMYAYKRGDYQRCLHCCLHRTYTRCSMLLKWPMFLLCRSLSSCWMMTLSHWLHWRWLSILSVDITLTTAASVSWLCRCIWWLSVSWSYVTQWCHWLTRSTALKSLMEDIQLIERLSGWYWSWLHVFCWHLHQICNHWLNYVRYTLRRTTTGGFLSVSNGSTFHRRWKALNAVDSVRHNNLMNLQAACGITDELSWKKYFLQCTPNRTLFLSIHSAKHRSTFRTDVWPVKILWF